VADRLNQISAFVEVARQGSFVRAAARLSVNVSATSRAVAALEARLGVRLLQRSTRRVALTEAGRSHFRRCEALLNEIDDAEAAVGRAAGAVEGRLRVSVPTGLGLTHLAPALPEFLAAHPAVTLDLHYANRIVDLVEEGFDLAIRVGGVLDPRLVARRLATSRRLPVASPAWLAAHGAPRRTADLARHPALVLDVGAEPERWTLVRAGRERHVRVTPRLRSGNALALAAACLGGSGIALLPDFVIEAPLAQGRLVRVLPGWASPEQGIHAIYPANRFIPAKVRAFADFIAARLATLR